MDLTEDNINQKTGILLSRNTPVALVVGASGFLGSYLCEDLLKMHMQVLGVDDFSKGVRNNLEEAFKDKNFHLISAGIEQISLNIPRLDYIFIVAEGNFPIERVLKIAVDYKSKIVLASYIELYDREKEKEYSWFKTAEIKLARFAKEHKLNARVVRMSAVYGPRMHFRSPDPVVRLIKSYLWGQLQSETEFEFLTRALFVDDAIELLVKSILSGSTALKIYDGVLPSPIKTAEVKQILLEPIWYENRGFKPTPLPVWQTPNLPKTQKELRWQPKMDFVETFKKTVNFFKDHPEYVPEHKEDQEQESLIQEKRWEIPIDDREEVEQKKEAKIRVKKDFKLPFNRQTVFVAVGLVIIFYAILFPVISLAVGIFTFRWHLSQAYSYLNKGEYQVSLNFVSQGQSGVDQVSIFLDQFKLLEKIGLFKEQFRVADKLVNISTLTSEAAKHAILGTKALDESLRSISGERNGSLKESLDLANLEMTAAEEKFSQALSQISRMDLSKNLPPFFADRVNILKDRLMVYTEIAKSGAVVSLVLPKMIGLDGKKSYLVLLQNNMELRPTGGFIGSLAQLDFEGGKLNKLQFSDVYSDDDNLKIHVEPPKEIKEDLGQKDWLLRDSNWEPDFPTSATQAEWFYEKETGVRVDGVISFDISAVAALLRVLGPLELPDYNEKITADSLFERAITHAGEKNFLTAVSSALFNKLIFVPKTNWPEILGVLGKSLEEKHVLIFLDDRKLFSYMVAQNLAGALPRPSAALKDNETDDFLAVVEANLGTNKANYYLNRSYFLETVIGQEGEINHRLRISYENNSPASAFPAGVYKNRLRIYLPFGAKISRALWGEADVTKDLSPFADYGRSAYSLLLQLNEKTTKNLILDYQLPKKIQFKDNQTLYKLDVIKQAGTDKDPFSWRFTFPINFKIIPKVAGQISPQELTILTDLAKDKRFEVKFGKN